MEPPNEAVRSAAPRTPEQAQGHTSWSKAEFLQGITAVPDLQTTGWKSRALNRKDFVSQKCLTLQSQIFQKFTLVWSTVWVTPAQNVSFCFNLFMNELQLQPLSQDGNTPRTGRELSKESSQTEVQKRHQLKQIMGYFITLHLSPAHQTTLPLPANLTHSLLSSSTASFHTITPILNTKGLHICKYIFKK